jgi:hypothetical protein
VKALLQSIELDEGRKANAAIALVLAAKLDNSQVSEAAGIAMAVSGIAKELRATLDAILGNSDDGQEFVIKLFQ